jgi:transcription elongation factor GreA
MAQKQTYLTREGLARILAELEHLRSVRRLEIRERLQNAKDLSGTEENADYDDARNEQAFVEGRILELENLLKNPVIIEEAKAPTGAIQIGSRFTLRDEDGVEDSYILVGTAEADAVQGRISNESPVGSAVLGHKVGDRVEVKVPDGVIAFTIVQIE